MRARRERGPLARIPGEPRLAARRAGGPPALPAKTNAAPCSFASAGRRRRVHYLHGTNFKLSKTKAFVTTIQHNSNDRGRLRARRERGPLARIPGEPRLAARHAGGPPALPARTNAAPCSFASAGRRRRVHYLHGTNFKLSKTKAFVTTIQHNSNDRGRLRARRERGPLARIPGEPRLAARHAGGPPALPARTNAAPCSFASAGRRRRVHYLHGTNFKLSKTKAFVTTIQHNSHDRGRLRARRERGPLARIPGEPRLAARHAGGPPALPADQRRALFRRGPAAAGFATCNVRG